MKRFSFGLALVLVALFAGQSQARCHAGHCGGGFFHGGHQHVLFHRHCQAYTGCNSCNVAYQTPYTGCSACQTCSVQNYSGVVRMPESERVASY